MKKYQYSGNIKKSNKKRFAVLALIVLWFLCFPVENNEDIFLRMTAQMIPLLTYEQQYGNPEVNYAADYQVPDWFYEDENEEPVNGDIIMETLEAEDNVTGNSVTTLADGKNGTTYTREQLKKPDFLLSKIFVVDSNTSMTKEELDIGNLLDTDLTVEGLKKTGEKKNIKCLFTTHMVLKVLQIAEKVKKRIQLWELAVILPRF